MILLDELIDEIEFNKLLKQFKLIYNTEIYVYKYSKKLDKFIRTKATKDFRPKLDICKNDNFGFCNLKIDNKEIYELLNITKYDYETVLNNRKYKKLLPCKCEHKIYKSVLECINKKKEIKSNCFLGNNIINSFPLYYIDKNNIKNIVAVVVVKFYHKDNIKHYYNIINPYNLEEAKLKKVLKNIRRELKSKKESQHFKRLFKAMIDIINKNIQLSYNCLED